MMAGYGLVVGNGLDCVQVAIRRVVGIDKRAAGAAAIGSSRLVISRRRSFRQKVRHGNNFNRSLRQISKERRQLSLHGRYVTAICGQQRFRRVALSLGFAFRLARKLARSFEAKFLRDGTASRFRRASLHPVRSDGSDRQSGWWWFRGEPDTDNTWRHRPVRRFPAPCGRLECSRPSGTWRIVCRQAGLLFEWRRAFQCGCGPGRLLGLHAGKFLSGSERASLQAFARQWPAPAPELFSMR